MANQAYKDYYVQGLQALVTAGEHGKEAAAATAQAASNPELKRLVEEGSQTAERQAEQLRNLLRQAGGRSDGKPNPIMDGIRAGTREIVESAKDAETRDAGVIASSQIALHYHIAAFGTLASTAKHLGMSDEAAAVKRMSDETKALDERYTQLAESSVNRQAA